MTERDGVLIGFAGGDTAARQALARRLTDFVSQRGAWATVLTGAQFGGHGRAGRH